MKNKKKLIFAIIILVVAVIALIIAYPGVKKCKAVANCIIDASDEELRKACEAIDDLSQIDMLLGKGIIKKALIERLSDDLNMELSMEYLVDKKNVQRYDQYKVIATHIGLYDDKNSNIDDFIDLMLSLKPYAKYNTLHNILMSDKANRYSSEIDNYTNLCNTAYSYSQQLSCYSLLSESLDDMKSLFVKANQSEYGIRIMTGYYNESYRHVHDLSLGRNSSMDTQITMQYLTVLGELSDAINDVSLIMDEFPNELH